MSGRPPFAGRRLTPVSLADVPLTIRRRRGEVLLRAAKEAGDIVAALDLTRAIEAPSRRPYLLPEDAVVRVLGRLP
jgi:hypothetical protein